MRVASACRAHYTSAFRLRIKRAPNASVASRIDAYSAGENLGALTQTELYQRAYRIITILTSGTLALILMFLTGHHYRPAKPDRHKMHRDLPCHLDTRIGFV